MTEKTIVRDNLMNDEGYRPYCGNNKCTKHNPRVNWNKGLSQFICSCGWISKFSEDFIERYKEKWSK